MHRFLLIFALLFVSLHAQGEIDKKIKKTSSRLHSYSKNYSSLNKKMAKTAKAILRQKRELLKQDAYLKKLKEELLNKESSYKINTKELQRLKEAQNRLKKRQNRLEEELVFVIAKSVSLSVILNEEYPANEKSLIELEVLKSMLKESQQKAKHLSDLYIQNSKIIQNLHAKTDTIEKSIASIDSKRKELLKKQAENKKALKKLKLAKSSYKRELKKLLKRQSELKKTLSQLNLIKVDEIKKAKEEQARKKAFAKQKIVLNENLPKVKKHGSSYQSVRTIRYNGPKTIAPLSRYTITKKYGTYTDPIYGIKIFNESISLKPKQLNSKVKTVFNGKVIYADKTAVLDNIVIVEHKNGLHTIYANLSQIAPNIRKGKKVKRGAVIGRVRDELVFEVTQKSAHINPIRLFR
ncbi:peptidoglycan DD-metalloendopeptidase family protein [Sulfurimonas paralvinellae]|uniref:Peptidoglycan DD-metalloendopeptidase family protein n=2 Tax=Sulfurimonas paralvinellae TaxID=317658 RepID=A0A7M1BAH0_9BACT|nr:peptidoglycan DD-metalloendopeptidase family protein [Sulfurimonas paralvinellae]